MKTNAWQVSAIQFAGALLLNGVLASSASAADEPTSDGAWPEITAECRPWAYNWWLGSAVDPTNLTRQMEQYRDAGLGGIHIIPIYGAKGYEARYVEYLSPRWLELFTFAVQEGHRLGLGVDLTTGTGWCFGGPNVALEDAGVGIKTGVSDPPADGDLERLAKGLNLIEVVARSAGGERLVLTDKLTGDGKLNWQPKGPGWKLYWLGEAPTRTRVKRAAPGGVGFMLNPFYGQAMSRYLERFTQAFQSPAVARPRAMYHDSFEYYGCQCSPDLWKEFARRRGYRLEDQLEAFAGDGDPDTVARVKSDYRETVSDLMVENVFPRWIAWCQQHGMLTRNQAHGSPGNWLDLYALADIPETEMFGRGTRDPLVSRFDARFAEGDREPLVSKFASSAAHTAGRRLVASETCTWMAEHFCETLEEAKCFADRMFVCGVNHLFYHGCCYSPAEAPWPGWLFYAATEMNPRNAIWHDVPALNAYIARCQAVLQSGVPDNNVLLYWPVYDRWHRADGVLEQFTVHNRDWLLQEPIGTTARQLWTRGFGFDYVSDRGLAQARPEDGGIRVTNSLYRTVVVPPTKHIPLATLRILLGLAESGATVIFADHLPVGVPGSGQLDQRRGAFKQALDRLALKPVSGAVSLAVLGKGRVLAGELEAALAAAGVDREPLTDHPGAMFIRRRNGADRSYFIANQGTQTMQGWVALGTAAESVVLMDALRGSTGRAEIRHTPQGKAEVSLRLEPGHSLFLRTSVVKTIPDKPWEFLAAGRTVMTLAGPWEVRFTVGGPVLPKPYEIEMLTSWTANGDPETERFGGTAVYTTSFSAPQTEEPLVLDLGRVCHSARVRLNGQALGTVFMAPYRLSIPPSLLKPPDNRLEVEVTNLSANRVRDLDRRQVPWRTFQDINFVSITYKPFNAAQWPLFDSGLLGPVVLRAQAP